MADAFHICPFILRVIGMDRALLIQKLRFLIRRKGSLCHACGHIHCAQKLMKRHD